MRARRCSLAARTQQTMHLMDTRVHTPIGDIVAPRGANDVTNLNDRIAIAVNAFDYMYQHLFTGNSSANWAAVNRTLAGRMNSATLPQRPRIFGIPI
jgi:hypothetical protein